MILNDIINAKEVLDKIANQELPVKVSYQLSKLIAATQTEFNLFEKERSKLIVKYGELQEDGSTKVVDNLEQFQKDYIELVKIEVDITEPLIDLDSIKGVLLTPKEVLLINKFIKDS